MLHLIENLFHLQLAIAQLSHLRFALEDQTLQQPHFLASRARFPYLLVELQQLRFGRLNVLLLLELSFQQVMLGHFQFPLLRALRVQ
ncbi:MAG: hypothetical protein EBZ67_10285 [Chitinophagia bacterium]|nr:hypothetical protein [Chitinophagia bacterium]